MILALSVILWGLQNGEYLILTFFLHLFVDIILEEEFSFTNYS